MAFLDKTGLECLWGHIAAKLAGKSNVNHTHTAAEIGADASGAAAAALTSAKSYTDEAVAGATEGMVKSVNGVLPDENGEVTSHHTINIVLYDNTCYPGGEVLCYTHTAKELVKMFRNTTVRMPIVTRRVAAMSGTYKPDVFLQNFNIVIIDGGYEVHFHYGDEYADIIANNVTDTITLDPNWVAPEATATEAYVDDKISAIPQSDWFENNTTSKAYVQNRTHYEELFESLPETVVEQPADSTDEWPLTTPFTVIPEVGKTYRVTWKGTDYDCVAQGFDIEGIILPTLGNLEMVQGTGDNGMPFVVSAIPAEMVESLGAYGMVYPIDGSEGSVTLAIQEANIHKISEKFLPDTIAKASDLEGYASETYVGEQIAAINIPVNSVNGKTGAVVLSASDVGADVAGTATELVSKVESAIINNEYIVFEANSEDGINYTATIEGLTAIKTGALLVMIPKLTSASRAGIVLNINGLGNKSVYRETIGSLSYGATNDWLSVGHPYIILYKGSYWTVINLPKISATDLQGTVPVTSGGTGATTAAEARTNLGITPENIGALPNTTVIPSIEGLATETYVNTAISNLVDSSPETLNTLNELAAALGDDPNFATTVATEIGKKVDKTTTINGKALSSNITLSASDVGAATNIKDGSGYKALMTIGATEASGNYSFAEGRSTIASGLGSHAEGSNAVANGHYSHAEGSDTNAVGNYSHAEGRYVIANGNYSHAEGHETSAIGDYSHAEGRSYSVSIKLSGEANATTYTYTINSPSLLKVGRIIRLKDQLLCVKITEISDTLITVDQTLSSVALSEAEGLLYCGSALGIGSHVEGYNTTTNGEYSHAEGKHTTATGHSSHAEGYSTNTTGEYSHAEGYGTIAASTNQHVQGKYNIEDTNTTFVHIVGNGAYDYNRSNAHTLDWDGNAWFAGDVYVGSTSGKNKDEGSLKLATESYVDTLIAEIPYATDEEIYAMMIEEDAFPVIQTENGFVLCSAENEILMI